MKTHIEIIQDETDKTDYLKMVIAELNKKFTTQEKMEQRWELSCLEVAQKLGAKVEMEWNLVVFDFSTV